MKRHLKRLPAPKAWKVKRKVAKFIVRPLPGAHSFKSGLPLGVILRDYLCYAQTMKEAKNILKTTHVLVDDERRTDHRFQVGLMDVVTTKETKEHFRIVLDKSGHLQLIKIPDKEALHKPKKVINKTVRKNGVLQLNLFDGHNMLVKEGSYKVGDTILVEFPGKITDHFKLEPGALVYITGGKHQGNIGTVETVDKEGVSYKSKSGKYLVQKRHAFVVGSKQPCISLGSS